MFFVQHCRQSQCIYQGCRETKLILLHLKTCQARKNNSDCPLPECRQARNLLNHYRQCREVRLDYARRCQMVRKDVGSTSSTSKSDERLQYCQPVEPPPSCLICSMVARHVRNILEHGPRSAPVPLIERKLIPKRTDSRLFMPPPPPRRPRSTSAPSLEEVSTPTVAATAAIVMRNKNNLYRQRSSSDGMLCNMNEYACETIREEAEPQQQASVVE